MACANKLQTFPFLFDNHRVSRPWHGTAYTQLANLFFIFLQIGGLELLVQAEESENLIKIFTRNANNRTQRENALFVSIETERTNDFWSHV